jgi:hypothetical protein
MGGARTLDEAAKQVRALANEIEELSQGGLELGAPVGPYDDD